MTFLLINRPGSSPTDYEGLLLDEVWLLIFSLLEGGREDVAEGLASCRSVSRRWARLLDDPNASHLWSGFDVKIPFMKVCASGRLFAAQWLVAIFRLTAEDARIRDNEALRLPCANGHLAIAQWLVAEFGLTAEDARIRDNEALRMSCGNGRLAIAQC